MAKFSLATNFDNSLLKEASRLNARYSSTGNKIVEVFGAFPSNFGYNSGRLVTDLPEITFKQLKKHVELSLRFGLSFNYILNEVCLGGMEYEAKGMNEILKFIDRLAEIKVAVITVSKPFLAQLISKKYSNFLVNASVISGIDSFQKAKEWIDLGIQRLTLSDATRDFALINRLKRTASVEIELRANSACRAGSSLCFPHYLDFSHTVKKRSPTMFLLSLNCKLARLSDPVDYLFKRGTWIRPEDLSKYDQAGVDIYKILDRICSTKELLKRAKAYLSESYEGNLLSLLGSGKGTFEFSYLDNRKMEGFIDHFMMTKCTRECNICDYCEKFAARCLTVKNEKRRRDSISKYERLIELCLG